jgi:enoyl-CoA hydratase
MNYKYLIVDKKPNGIVLLTLSREKSLNALNSEMLKELHKFFSHIEDDIRCIIVTGAGKSFVAGADIAEMANFTASEAYDFAKLGMDTFMEIEKCRVPVIAAVNGFALGGGCEISVACDIRLASTKAKFGQPEVGLGITPGFGGTQRLARTIGPGFAKELIYTTEMIDANKALEIKLVNHVYEPDELIDKAIEMAEQIVSKAPKAVEYAKQSIINGSQTDIDTAMQIEKTHFGLCFATNDQKEGMKAFLDKNRPKFIGE